MPENKYTYYIPDGSINTVHSRFITNVIEQLPAKKQQDFAYFVYKYVKGEQAVSIRARYKPNQVTALTNGKCEPKGPPTSIEAVCGEKRIDFVGQSLPNIVSLLELLSFSRTMIAFFRRMQCTCKFENINFTFKYDINSRNQRCMTIEVPKVGPIANVDQVIGSLEQLLALDNEQRIADYEFA